MFVGEKKQDPLNGIIPTSTRTEDDDLNERADETYKQQSEINYSQSTKFYDKSLLPQSTKFYDKSLIPTKPQESDRESVDYDLTKTNYNKSLAKKVQF